MVGYVPVVSCAVSSCKDVAEGAQEAITWVGGHHLQGHTRQQAGRMTRHNSLSTSTHTPAQHCKWIALQAVTLRVNGLNARSLSKTLGLILGQLNMLRKFHYWTKILSSHCRFTLL